MSAPYILTVSGKKYVVLDSEQQNFHRVQTADGQVIGVPCVDSAEPLTAEELEEFLASPPARVLAETEAEALLDTILDDWAREWGYASAARCITYRGDKNPIFAAEAEAMFEARSDLWTGTIEQANSPARPPLTEANVRAHAAQYKPTRPVL